jgi:hypothetical protein
VLLNRDREVFYMHSTNTVHFREFHDIMDIASGSDHDH